MYKSVENKCTNLMRKDTKNSESKLEHTYS